MCPLKTKTEKTMASLDMRVAATLAVPAFALAGCSVVPVAPDGTPLYPVPRNTPFVRVPAPIVPVPAPSSTVANARMSTVLTARRYPANEPAARSGMITGTVTNLMTGKGRFPMEFHGEILSGEATRVQGDEKRGVANAYGDRRSCMRCDYPMSLPYRSAGSCTLSSGEKYTVHLGG
jgi:hypothetical protein